MASDGRPPVRPGGPGLLASVSLAARARRLSPRTEEAYRYWARRFVLFHDRRSPREMAEAEVAAFLTHLAVSEHVAPSTQNQALAALLFLYREVLRRPLGRLPNTVRAKRPKRLPVVLSQDEVRRLFEHLQGEPRLVAELLYGAGLRLLEALRSGHNSNGRAPFTRPTVVLGYPVSNCPGLLRGNIVERR